MSDLKQQAFQTGKMIYNTPCQNKEEEPSELARLNIKLSDLNYDLNNLVERLVSVSNKLSAPGAIVLEPCDKGGSGVNFNEGVLFFAKQDRGDLGIKEEEFLKSLKQANSKMEELTQKDEPTSPGPMITKELSFGEKLVGIGFNPANDDSVSKAERLCADLADLLNNENNSKESTQFSQRLFSHAVGEILNAQMNVVKVLTLKY